MRTLCISVAAAAVALLMLLAAPSEHSAHESTEIFGVQDICIVDYPEFWQLMHDGEVTVTDGDLTVRLVKKELGWYYLQRLSIMVKAE